MNVSMINGLVGMQATQQKIDTISNNIANIETTGYKGREIFFQDILSSRIEQPDSFRLQGRMTPMGLDQATGSRVSLTLGNFNQGQPIETGVSTDLMLMGKDIFFTVIPADGNSLDPKELRYTRDGHFQIDAEGYLVTDQGDYVLDTYDFPIEIPEQATFQVDKQGNVIAEYADGTKEEIATLKLTRIISLQALAQDGANQYRIPAELIDQGIEVRDQNFDLAEPRYANLYAVIQGSLEASNVELAKEMVQLTEAQRAYQFQSRGISIADQMAGMVNNLRG
ncbi:flagellar hook-basal body protein [Tepidibacillus decaturensis]|uniref:Uncharacterized protein n=1 Tax=Tepidibacillus decaturensis TaxID=1413211 RepID=A0A135L727_9BACI|nr:flagellar hook-basal body protein [Tepidibacillus decaturensis]KXG44623.1 hypothetical protein U473_11785 [Tepidibacillus decaturensis]